MKNTEMRKAAAIGSTCVVTYIASYFMRNILGVLTPQMLQTGLFTKEWIGALSSAYMLCYAIGQLTNGFLGDRLSAKHMVVTGIMLAGGAAFLFPLLPLFALQIICFGVFGYGLSMLRGPMMRMIAENTKEKYARVICAFFSSAGFIGAFIAGIFAAAFQWRNAFFAAGALCLLIALTAYLVITRMERRGLIQKSVKQSGGKKDFFGVLAADQFVFYIFISMIVEITATSVNFWIPTYLTEHLGFGNNTANMIFIVKNLLRSLSPFIAIAIYERMQNEIRLLKYSFLASALLLFSMVFIKNAWLNIFVFFLALVISGFAAAVLWSIYIPSLKKTGKVSSGNGILDCAGYLGAATANMAFAGLADHIGWNGIILLWTGIVFAGFLLAFVHQQHDRAGSRKRS